MRALEFTGAAGVITDFTLGIRSGEGVLIVRDTHGGEFPGVNALLDAVTSAVHARGAEPQILTFVSRPLAGMEPPKIVAEAMKAADAVIIMTSLSMLQTVATTEALRSGTRVVMLPPARYLLNSPDLLHRMMPADLQDEEERLRLAERVAQVFRRGRRIRVTSPKGTDITMGIGRLKILHNPTTAREPGQTTIVPGGQILAGVTRGEADGRFVVDASASPIYRPLASPITCVVEGGRVVEIAGQEDAREYRALLESFNDPGVFEVAEVGVGIHPRARLSGVPLEDERILGAAWIAVGTSVHLGGEVKAALHSDCVMLPPISLTVDGELVMEDRRFFE
jgi:leucyl aminopeptidase (aminopeptidase T)